MSDKLPVIISNNETDITSKLKISTYSLKVRVKIIDWRPPGLSEVTP